MADGYCRGGAGMFLKRVSIKNFRSVRDATVDLDSQTAFVGGNGSGKSTLLRAIDRFYGQSTSIDPDDFFGRNLTNPIEIGLTFNRFTNDEREMFKSRIFDDEMAVVRVFEADGGRTNGRYYGATMQHAAFAEIRAAQNFNAARTAYNNLRESHEQYSALQAARSAEQLSVALQAWESNHSDSCELLRDDGQFFGFSNVAKGALQKATSFVFIPAVRDAAADALDSRGAVIARLLELVVRSAVQRRSDIREFQTRVSDEYQKLTDPEKLYELRELGTELTRTLQLFYRDTAVALQWQQAGTFEIPLPAADVFLDDDGFEGPVDRKGHGLQRAFILSLLQHLAHATSAEAANHGREAEAQNQEEQPEAQDQEEQPDTPAAEQAQPETRYTLPGLILAIEEPELYQHPTKQRHFAKVLSQLSNGELPGVATQTQVLFATHSSLFVSMDRFDEVRLARRHKTADASHKECRLSWATLADVAQTLELAHGARPGEYTAEGLKARLHIIDSEIAEGLFADLAVLVEGAGDRAAILAEASGRGEDFEALGIAVLVADGKSNLDKPAAIFSSLGVPAFVVWDCDKKNGEIKGAPTNRALQKLMGRPADSIADALSTISDTYACFETKLETVIKNEIGGELYQRLLDEVKNTYGILRNNGAEKAPFAMRRLLERANAEGKTSATLRKIVDAILALRKLQDLAAVAETTEGGAE